MIFTQARRLVALHQMEVRRVQTPEIPLLRCRRPGSRMDPPSHHQPVLQGAESTVLPLHASFLPALFGLALARL